MLRYSIDLLRRLYNTLALLRVCEYYYYYYYYYY